MGANPDVAGKADGNTSNVGDVQAAQLPNIVGTMEPAYGAGHAWRFTGAFTGTGTRDGSISTPGTSCPASFNLDSSNPGASSDHLGNNVYIDNGEVRTANIRMNYIIKY